ncbi:ABC-type multidrug transport system fused ATPase/permease subunit [Sphingomonas zeicaulis]|uniref:ABC transporter ATP-binding protein n=1 Tax=Sphingomonas zeicaulis TaxID=1632740 RepID=UPI003D217CCF
MTDPSGATRRHASRFVRYPLLRSLALYRHRPVGFLITLALFTVVNGSLALQQGLVGHAVDEARLAATAGRAFDGIGVQIAVGLLVAVAAVRGVLLYIAGYLSISASQALLSLLREKILIQVQSLHLGFHWAHGIGALITRTTRDADKLRDALVAFWRQVVETTLIVIASVGLLLWYDIGLGLVPLLLTIAGCIIFVVQTDRLVLLDRKVADAYDRVNQDLSEGISGVRVIKSFRLEDGRTAKFGAEVASYVEQSRAALAWCSSRIPVPQAVVALGHVWILAYGARLVADGRIQVGDLVASMLIATTLVFRIEAVGRVMRIFADARASAARIWELLDERSILVEGNAAIAEGEIGLRVEEVTYRAPGGDVRILDRCGFTLRPGEIVALVGATGSGKSSLASLLPRLADPDGGTIRIGSDQGGWQDLRNVRLAELRRRIHVVPQDIFLFSDTLAANLRVGAPDATDADLHAALRLAAAEDVLEGLPEGLDTRLGDRGITLSGGQRQRLCLARALIAEPDILVLDDATSALDALTERRVLANIRALRGRAGGRLSVLLVTSKLSSVLLADRVLLLAGGRIAATGRHDDLAADPIYRDLLGIDDAAA